MQRKVYGGFCSGLGFPGVFLAGSEDDNASEMGRIGGPGSEGLDLEAAKKCCGYAIKNSDDVHEASVGVGNLRCRRTWYVCSKKYMMPSLVTSSSRPSPTILTSCPGQHALCIRSEACFT